MNEHIIKQIVAEEIGKFMKKDFQDDDIIPINPDENLGIVSINDNNY